MEEVITSVEPAILVRGVSKQYWNDPKILDNLDMTVPKGVIYGLLGASGCGKTTLLSAILGSRKIQNGSISILGKAPGVVPIESIGYMPQDIALVGELSIKNVLQQQGWIFGMTNKQIEERHKFCEKLLDLPPGNKLIKNLSGGQQRRVSLAVVLIPDPELLILDEPTVGLDPVLRQNLWDYLIKITNEEKKTVVITTHYIEEAKQANMVGMLRYGKMITEGEPQTLLQQFNYSSLEDLFVSLSAKQEDNDDNLTNLQPPNRLVSKSEELRIFNQIAPKKSLVEKLCFMKKGHLKALLSKNFIRYIRHPGTILTTILIPIIQISSAFMAVGRIPGDLKIGVVNLELGEYRNCEDYSLNKTIGGHVVDEFGTCEYEGLSCKFTEIFKNVIPNQVNFESLDDALQAVKERKIREILVFPHNFSESLTIVNNFNDVHPEEANFSKVAFYRDDADDPLGSFMEKELYNSYLKFAEELADDCHWNKRAVKFPLHFNAPIYGDPDLTFGDFIAMGNMAIGIIFLPKSLAITTIISERNDGVWERTVISGIKAVEILICHTVTLSLIAAIQSTEMILFSYYVFGFECAGNMFYAIVLLFLLGVVGVTIGILLSIVSRSEMVATFGALGIAFPMFLLSGCVWPLVAQPEYVQLFSYYVLPSTIPIESLNNIIFKGWGITNFHVYKGFLVSCGYICVCTILSTFGLQFENKQN